MAQNGLKVNDEITVREELADPFYSKENMDELKRRIDDVRSGKCTLKEHEIIKN